MSEYIMTDSPWTLRDPEHSIVGESLPGHTYEPGVRALLGELLQKNPQAIFLDIGAMYGFYSLWVKALAPLTEVHAFEPNPEFATVLRDNLAHCGERTQVHQVALSDEQDWLRMRRRKLRSRVGENSFRQAMSTLRDVANYLWMRRFAVRSFDIGHVVAWSSAGLSMAREDLVSVLRRKDYLVRAITLDEWSRQRTLFPSIAKIDVHGGEVQVLRGMREVLANSLKHLFVEVHPQHMLTDGSLDELLHIIESAGFDVWEIENFRSENAWMLTRLDSEKRAAFAAAECWNSQQRLEMRMIYARRT